MRLTGPFGNSVCESLVQYRKKNTDQNQSPILLNFLMQITYNLLVKLSAVKICGFVSASPVHASVNYSTLVF